MSSSGEREEHVVVLVIECGDRLNRSVTVNGHMQLEQISHRCGSKSGILVSIGRVKVQQLLGSLDTQNTATICGQSMSLLELGSRSCRSGTEHTYTLPKHYYQQGHSKIYMCCANGPSTVN
jgi:hypothetical protein